MKQIGQSTTENLYSDLLKKLKRLNKLVCAWESSTYTTTTSSTSSSTTTTTTTIPPTTTTTTTVDHFYFATADGSKTLNINIKFPVGKSITVQWGDTNSDVYNGAGATTVNITHTYGGAGSYDIYFEGDYLDLTWMECGDMSLSGNISGWSALTSLTYIICHTNSFTGDISGWSALTSLILLNCIVNSLTFDSSSAWTGHDHSMFISGNQMTSTMVDNWLIACAGGSFANKTLTGIGTNAARTSASDAAVATLTGNGNTVMTS